MKYRYQVRRNKRTQEELDLLKSIYNDERDEDGDLIFDLNDPDTIYVEPTVSMVCDKCGYEEDVQHMILVELNYGNKGLHALACPKCSHTKKRGTLYPKHITDLDGNEISYQDVLNNKK